VLRDVYWFKQIDMPRDSHIHTFFDPGGRTTLAPEARFVKMIPRNRRVSDRNYSF